MQLKYSCRDIGSPQDEISRTAMLRHGLISCLVIKMFEDKDEGYSLSCHDMDLYDVTTSSQEKIKGEDLLPCRAMRDLHVATSCIKRPRLEAALLACRDMKDLDVTT